MQTPAATLLAPLDLPAARRAEDNGGVVGGRVPRAAIDVDDAPDPEEGPHPWPR